MDNCPKCDVSLLGDPIPNEDREYYSAPYFWRREIGIEDPTLYDGTLWWKCPDCTHIWKRFDWSPDYNETKA